jgi:hypothetical protein
VVGIIFEKKGRREESLQAIESETRAKWLRAGYGLLVAAWACFML